MKEPPVIVEAGERPVRLEAPVNRRLARMRFLSRVLDNWIPLPGGYRIGIDPIIGLVPWVGDLIASTLSVWLIYDAARMGIKKRVLAMMVGNVLLESLAGAVPVLGDIFDAAWKANVRNVQLVEKYHSPADKPRSLAGLAAAFLLGLISFYALVLSALYLVWRAIYSLFNALI